MENVSTITEQQLLKNGWIKTNDSVFPFQKDITSGAENDDRIKLIVHTMHNITLFALSIPDGYIININPSCIEDLNQFEKMIVSVDTPY